MRRFQDSEAVEIQVGWEEVVWSLFQARSATRSMLVDEN